MSFDLVLRQGRVIDPAQGLDAVRDIGICDGRIAAVEVELPSAQAEQELDLCGRLVTPGLIDLHTHVAEHFMPIAAAADEAGVNSGVTAVCDAGSVGYVAFEAFKRYVIEPAQTDVFCFLHLCPTGQTVSPEICWEILDLERLLALLGREREIIRGIKLRANSKLVTSPDMAILKTAKQVCAQAELPLMIHIGLNFEEKISDEDLQAFNRRMLPLLDAGDILTHTFTARPGGVIFPDTGVMPELRDALERGVILDAAPAKSHFSFPVARMGLEAGIVPTTLSTDITKTNFLGPALFSLPVVMSKFLALGLTLAEVVAKTTIVPARILREAHRRGSVKLGYPADLTVFELLQGEFLFSDGMAGNTLLGKQLLEPCLTVKNGQVLPAGSRFRDHVPGEQVSLTTGA